jgi:hypothetical protein
VPPLSAPFGRGGLGFSKSISDGERKKRRKRARNELMRIDEREPEEIERYREHTHDGA